MSKTILAQVDGFTPIIDALIPEVGIIGAAIFGRMWRYCQMENGICHAALKTIAADLGISIRTVIRHSDELVKHGYLKDLTPDVRNEPHRYADTGKAGIKISVEGMTESHTRYDKESHLGMTESHLKKVSKKQKTVSAKKTADDHGYFSLAQAIANVCKMDLSKNRGMLFAEAKRLDESPDQVIEHYGPGSWWYENDWRGKKNQPPKPAQIRETWGQWGVDQTVKSESLLEFS